MQEHFLYDQFFTGLLLSIILLPYLCFVAFDVEIPTTHCPVDCVLQPCRMYAHATGEVSKGPCQCLKENSVGPPTLFCSEFARLENPTFLELTQSTVFIVVFTIFIILVSISLRAAIMLGLFDHLFASCMNYLRNSVRGLQKPKKMEKVIEISRG